MRGREGALDLPVVVMTAHGSLDRAVEALRLGACGYLLRPFDVEALDLTIDRVFAAQRHLRQNGFLRDDLERALIVAGGAPLVPAHFPLASPRAGAGAGADASSSARDTPDDLRLEPAVQALERRLIAAALEAAHGSKARASQRLEISERTLWYKLKKLGLSG